MEKIKNILNALECPLTLLDARPFRAEEDGRDYAVWKLDTDQGTMVLKRTNEAERAVYGSFFQEGGPVPKVYAFAEVEGEVWMLMEFISGQSMSRCTRDRLIRTLDALCDSQSRWWGDESHTDIGYGFHRCWSGRHKRLMYMGELTDAYEAYLEEFSRVPRTLCNDDLLPFNVLADEERAVILDWEYGGILPYPSALARFLAFGEEGNDLFQMTEADRSFALTYYYEKLVAPRGISRAEYDRTMDLFFFKEYSEWVYCAAVSGDYEMEYYKKYGEKARILARKLGLLKEKEVTPCFD